MKEEIISITEACSMQPRTLKIGDNLGSFKDPKVVFRIAFQIDPNNADVYAGYNKNDQLLFKWIVKTTNVHFV